MGMTWYLVLVKTSDASLIIHLKRSRVLEHGVGLGGRAAVSGAGRGDGVCASAFGRGYGAGVHNAYASGTGEGRVC